MELFRRENYLRKIRGFYDEDDIIKVITGVRRCGKYKHDAFVKAYAAFVGRMIV